MQSILYLLVNEQKSSFKIGITDDLKARHARLSAVWGTFDLASSRTVAGTRKDISGLEKTLHYLLDKWRFLPSVKTDGHTEWFSMDCFDTAVEIITSATNLRDLKLDNQIINEMTINIDTAILISKSYTNLKLHTWINPDNFDVLYCS